jgi:PadR family transcriptional regulator, regulatory protein PadR
MLSADLKRGSMATLILTVLRDGALHGYQLAREIERRSEGYFECKEGTLYPALHKLEREGLLRGEWQQVGEQRRRRSYALTPAGERFLAASAAEWRMFTSRLLHMIAE